MSNNTQVPNALEQIKVIALSIDSFLSLTWFSCMILMMVKTKCKIERSGLVFLVSYSINNMLRTLFDIARILLEKEDDEL